MAEITAYGASWPWWRRLAVNAGVAALFIPVWLLFLYMVALLWLCETFGRGGRHGR